jgi:hypothetical protein
MAADTLPFTCPDEYLSGSESFEHVCAVLIPDHDELVRRLHEPRTVHFHYTDELAPADAAEIAVRRIAVVADANGELRRLAFTPDPDEEARRLTDEDAYNDARRFLGGLMRAALADRRLTPYGRGPTGEMERLTIDNPEVWRREGLLPGLDSVPDDILSPGPDMAGKPFFLKRSELHDFLAALQQALQHALDPVRTDELVAEPAPVAGAAESPASLARRPSDKAVKDFVAAYIKNKADEKNRTKVGLCKAAKDGLPGATRARLRDEFERQVGPPRRGRPRTK